VSIRLTIVADDYHCQGDDLRTEHGLSILAETERSGLLFDAGQTDVCVRNVERLGADLARVGTVVLSHGHYDHGGGVPAVLDAVGRARVIAHPAAFAAKYARAAGQQDRYIGLRYSADDLIEKGAAVALRSQSEEIDHGVLTTGPIPRETDFELSNSAFQVKSADGWRPDDFEDEQALIARTPEGPVVVVGCAHAGVVNTLRHALRMTGEDHIRALMGGFHLVGASEERITETIAALRELDVRQMVACHCTGGPARERLRAAFGERYADGGVGFRLTL
jgi:7,8-dihydropterin-6-yl-methyl-4-(beta-D-ribofuranosyl)aminobenzene 5'-phosphate synthase